METKTTKGVLLGMHDGRNSMNYDALSDRDLDALVAERVMGWIHGEAYNGEGLWKAPDDTLTPDDCFWPSTDDNAARLVRNRIAELGLQSEFRTALLDLLSWNVDHDTVVVFDAMQSTPRQQAIAALRATRSNCCLHEWDMRFHPYCVKCGIKFVETPLVRNLEGSKHVR